MSVLINKWTLRCYFWIAGYTRRFLNDEFIVIKAKDKPVTSASKFPLGTRNVLYKVYDKTTNDPVFTAHIPLDPAGVPLGGRTFADDLDPKAMLFEGVVYVKDETWPDPALNRRVFGWFYKRWRRARCWSFRFFRRPAMP